MSKKIEIFENTLLKLLVRRGIDADRRNVILSEGELGYTTDTKRLYIGDGQTLGGVLIGGNSSSCFEPQNDILTIANTVPGDLAFSTNTNSFYRFKGPVNGTITNWDKVGGVYSAGDNTINISTNNTITVNPISAGYIHSSALGNSLILDNNSRVGLNTQSISADNINSYSGGSLNLPKNLAIGGVNYTWPVGGGGTEMYLTTNLANELSWSEGPRTPTTVFVAGTAGQIPVGSIMPFSSTTNAPAGWLLCNGQSVLGTQYRELSATIGTSYGGDNISFNVPDYINKSLYGVQTSPSTSTTFRIATSSTATLSAAGALYIIKAKPDNVVNPTFTVTSPLTATLNNVDITGTSTSTLSGEIVIGMSAPATVTGSYSSRNKIINGNFDVWQRGTATLNQVATSPTLKRTADRWLCYTETGDRGDTGTYDVTRRSCTQVELSSFNADFYQRLLYKTNLGVGTMALYNSMSTFDGTLAAQGIESAASVLGKTLTLTFWARASQNTKIFSKSQIYSTATFGGSSMFTPSITNISDLTTQWQKFTHTITMPTFEQVSAVAYNPDHLRVTRSPFLDVPNYRALGSFNALPPLSSWIHQIDIKTSWSKGTSVESGNAWSGNDWDGYVVHRPGQSIDYPGAAMTPIELRDVTTSVLSGGGWYDIAQIQLEEGAETPYEQKLLGVELDLCQRYYEAGGPIGPDLYGGLSPHHLCTVNYNIHQGLPSYNVAKARVPTVTFWRPSLGKYGTNSQGFIENANEGNPLAVTSVMSNQNRIGSFQTVGNVLATTHTNGLMQIGWDSDAEI